MSRFTRLATALALPLLAVDAAAQMVTPGGTGSPRTSAGFPCSRFWVDVTDHGAKPDDATDDTAAVQAAVDEAMAAGGGSVVFPAGVYDMGTVEIGPGLRLFGHGAVLRKLPNQPDFSRTFTTTGQYLHDAASDSRPLVVEGFTFDGNMLQQIPYLSSEKEHQASIFLMAANSQPGRLVAHVRDCHFHDSPADGVGVYTNTRVSVSNCSGRDIFRGLVTATGGHSIVHVENVNGDGDVHPAGIDVETDGPGWNGSLATSMTLDGLDLAGRFDLGVGAGSRVVVNNVITRGARFAVYARDAHISLSNSQFSVGSNVASNRLVYPNDVSITNCTFTLSEPEQVEQDRELRALDVAWEIAGPGNSGPQNLRVSNCRFLADDTVDAGDTLIGIYSGATSKTSLNRLDVRGVQVGSGFDTGVWIERGGFVHLSASYLDAETAVMLRASLDRNLDVTLDDLECGPSTVQALDTWGAHVDDVIRHRNVVIDEGRNVLNTSAGLDVIDFRGSRTILGAGAPVSEPGILGDVWRLRTPLAGQAYEWTCTDSDETAATWVVKTTL